MQAELDQSTVVIICDDESSSNPPIDELSSHQLQQQAVRSRSSSTRPRSMNDVANLSLDDGESPPSMSSSFLGVDDQPYLGRRRSIAALVAATVTAKRHHRFMNQHHHQQHDSDDDDHQSHSDNHSEENLHGVAGDKSDEGSAAGNGKDVPTIMC